MAIPCRGIDFVPPPQAYQSPSSYVFKVIKVCGEEEHCYNKNEDAVQGKDVSLRGLVYGGFGISVSTTENEQAGGEDPKPEEVDQDGSCEGISDCKFGEWKEGK